MVRNTPPGMAESALHPQRLLLATSHGGRAQHSLDQADLRAEASQLYLNLFSDQVGFPPESSLPREPALLPLFTGSTTFSPLGERAGGAQANG